MTDSPAQTAATPAASPASVRSLAAFDVVSTAAAAAAPASSSSSPAGGGGTSWFRVASVGGDTTAASAAALTIESPKRRADHGKGGPRSAGGLGFLKHARLIFAVVHFISEDERRCYYDEVILPSERRKLQDASKLPELRARVEALAKAERELERRFLLQALQPTQTQEEQQQRQQEAQKQQERAKGDDANPQPEPQRLTEKDVELDIDAGQVAAALELFRSMLPLEDRVAIALLLLQTTLVAKGRYNSRTRANAARLFCALGLSFTFVSAFEIESARSVGAAMTAAAGSAAAGGNSVWSYIKKGTVVLVAAAAGAAVLFFTGGIAAPAVGAALASIGGIFGGTAIAGATASALALATTTNLTIAFAVGGGYLGAKHAGNRTLARSGTLSLVYIPDDTDCRRIALPVHLAFPSYAADHAQSVAAQSAANSFLTKTAALLADEGVEANALRSTQMGPVVPLENAPTAIKTQLELHAAEAHRLLIVSLENELEDFSQQQSESSSGSAHAAAAAATDSTAPAVTTTTRGGAYDMVTRLVVRQTVVDSGAPLLLLNPANIPTGYSGITVVRNKPFVPGGASAVMVLEIMQPMTVEQPGASSSGGKVTECITPCYCFLWVEVSAMEDLKANAAFLTPELAEAFARELPIQPEDLLVRSGQLSAHAVTIPTQGVKIIRPATAKLFHAAPFVLTFRNDANKVLSVNITRVPTPDLSAPSTAAAATAAAAANTTTAARATAATVGPGPFSVPPGREKLMLRTASFLVKEVALRAPKRWTGSRAVACTLLITHEIESGNTFHHASEDDADLTRVSSPEIANGSFASPLAPHDANSSASTASAFGLPRERILVAVRRVQVLHGGALSQRVGCVHLLRHANEFGFCSAYAPLGDSSLSTSSCHLALVLQVSVVSADAPAPRSRFVCLEVHVADSRTSDKVATVRAGATLLEHDPPPASTLRPTAVDKLKVLLDRTGAQPAADVKPSLVLAETPDFALLVELVDTAPLFAAAGAAAGDKRVDEALLKAVEAQALLKVRVLDAAALARSVKSGGYLPEQCRLTQTVLVPGLLPLVDAARPHDIEQAYPLVAAARACRLTRGSQVFLAEWESQTLRQFATSIGTASASAFAATQLKGHVKREIKGAVREKVIGALVAGTIASGAVALSAAVGLPTLSASFLSFIDNAFARLKNAAESAGDELASILMEQKRLPALDVLERALAEALEKQRAAAAAVAAAAAAAAAPSTQGEASAASAPPATAAAPAAQGANQPGDTKAVAAAAAVAATAVKDEKIDLRPVTLIGVSFGALVVVEALKKLAERKAPHIVCDVILCGAPQHIDVDDFETIAGVVSGRVINCYSRDDPIIRFLGRINLDVSLGLPAGQGPARGAENVDCSAVIAQHVDWALPQSLEAALSLIPQREGRRRQVDASSSSDDGGDGDAGGKEDGPAKRLRPRRSAVLRQPGDAATKLVDNVVATVAEMSKQDYFLAAATAGSSAGSKSSSSSCAPVTVSAFHLLIANDTDTLSFHFNERRSDVDVLQPLFAIPADERSTVGAKKCTIVSYRVCFSRRNRTLFATLFFEAEQDVASSVVLHRGHDDDAGGGGGEEGGGDGEDRLSKTARVRRVEKKAVSVVVLLQMTDATSIAAAAGGSGMLAGGGDDSEGGMDGSSSGMTLQDSDATQQQAAKKRKPPPQKLELVGVLVDGEAQIIADEKNAAAKRITASVQVLHDLKPFPLVVLTFGVNENASVGGPTVSAAAAAATAPAGTALQRIVSRTLLAEGGAPSADRRAAAGTASAARYLIAPVRSTQTAVTTNDGRIALVRSQTESNRALLAQPAARWLICGVDIFNASVRGMALAHDGTPDLRFGAAYVFGLPPRAIPPHNSTLIFLGIPEVAVSLAAHEQLAADVARGTRHADDAGADERDVKIAALWFTTRRETLSSATVSLRLDVFCTLRRAAEKEGRPYVVSSYYTRFIKGDFDVPASIAVIAIGDGGDEDADTLASTQRLLDRAEGGAVTPPVPLVADGCEPCFVSVQLK